MTKQLSADSDHCHILNPDESCHLANSSCWHLSMMYIYQCHIWLEVAFVLYAFDALAACTRADEHHSLHAFWEEVCTGGVFFLNLHWSILNAFLHQYFSSCLSRCWLFTCIQCTDLSWNNVSHCYAVFICCKSVSIRTKHFWYVLVCILFRWCSTWKHVSPALCFRTYCQRISAVSVLNCYMRTECLLICIVAGCCCYCSMLDFCD